MAEAAHLQADQFDTFGQGGKTLEEASSELIIMNWQPEVFGGLF